MLLQCLVWSRFLLLLQKIRVPRFSFLSFFGSDFRRQKWPKLKCQKEDGKCRMVIFFYKSGQCTVRSWSSMESSKLDSQSNMNKQFWQSSLMLSPSWWLLVIFLKCDWWNHHNYYVSTLFTPWHHCCEFTHFLVYFYRAK